MRVDLQPETDRPGEQAPTTLLTHPTGGSSDNCLARAAEAARDGLDEIVFVSGPEGAVDRPGHVILRDTLTGTIREADSRSGVNPLRAGLAAFGEGRRILASVPAATVRALLRLEPTRRARALQDITPLANLGHLAFGVAAPAPVAPTDNTKPPSDAPATDKDVHAWLDALGNAVSDDDKKKLAQTGDDATTLKNWFDDHKRGDPKLNDMPQTISDAENRLLSSDAVKNRIEVGSGNDKGKVTRDSLGDFVKDLDGAAKSATDSFNAFKKDNKNADPIALSQAADASILQANMPVLDAAGSSTAKVDNKINAADLTAVASGDGNTSLADPLKNAAKVYSNAGELNTLSNAGLDPSKKSDGTVNNDNFKSLLSKQTSKSEDDTISGLQSAALQQVVADSGGDASKVGKDYFDTGKSDASAADKAAAIVQLGQAVGRLNQGEAQYQEGGPANLDSESQYSQYYDGPSPGQQRSDFTNQIQQRINTLSQDPDVQKFLADKMPGALQGLVSADPGLKSAVQNQFDASNTGKALTDAFNQKDSKGAPISTTDALASFISKPNFYSEALGSSKPDYSKTLAAAPQDVQDKVKQGYNDITSGKATDGLTKSGMKSADALIKSAVDKTVYDSVLDNQTVQDGTDKFNDTAGKLGRSQLTDGKSGDDMLKGLGVSGADDPKLEQLVEDNLDSLSAPGKDQAAAKDILSVTRAANDALRGGLKFDDAMAKATNGDWKTTPGAATDAYKAGVFHGASALLLAGAMGAGISAGSNSSAQTAQQSLQVAGLLAEGGGKYYATTLGDMKSAVDGNKAELAALQQVKDGGGTLTPDQASRYTLLKNQSSNYDGFVNIGKSVENVGKAVGGVVGNALGLITGAIGAADASKNGKIGDAAAQGIFAGLNGISMVATATEVGSFMTTALTDATGKTIAPGIGRALGGLTLDALGGIAGAVGGIAGGAAAVGGLIYAIVKDIQADAKKSKDEDAWYKELQQGFAASGVTLPDLGTLLAPPYGTVPDENPPVEA